MKPINLNIVYYGIWSEKEKENQVSSLIYNASNKYFSRQRSLARSQRTDENNRPEPDENNVIQNDTDKVLLKDYDSPSGKYNSYDRNHPLYISQYIWHFILYSYNQ